jgi:hypothetical protein
MLAVLDREAKAWPTVDEWRSLLPSWFVQASRAEISADAAEEWLASWHNLPPEAQAEAENNEKWELADWLYWLEPHRREWYWWSATVLDPDDLEVLVEVNGWPAPLEALRWLFRAAGADEVVVED